MRFPRSSTRRTVAPRRDPQRQDRELSSLSSDAMECQPARYLWHARTIRRCGAEYADLRRERSREIQGNRYHARSAQLRSLPTVWSAHVSGEWKGTGDEAFAHVRSSALNRSMEVGGDR